MASLLLPLTLLTLLLTSYPGLAHPGGFAHTFVSTSNTGAVGAAESKVTGPDGATEGECVFSEGGRTIKVKYREEASGSLRAQAEGVSEEEALTLLKKCRTKVLAVGKAVDGVMKETQKTFEAIEEDMEQKMEKVNKKFQEFNRKMEEMSPTDKLQDHMEKMGEKIKKKQMTFAKKMDRMREKMQRQQEEMFQFQKKMMEQQRAFMDSLPF